MEANVEKPSSQENRVTVVSNHDNNEQSTAIEVFINHAEIRWHEMRRDEETVDWRSVSKIKKNVSRANNEEMVDFLIDI